MSYSINSIKNAGKKLVTDQNNVEALNILSYWRALHEKPLREASSFIQKSLNKHFKDNYILAQRLKRTPSIIKKLKRFNSGAIQLSTMQDIGGCRVILNSIYDVNRTVKILENTKKVNLRNNYIIKPKDDGYRSVHLTGIFLSRMIEIQVRTKVQHSWATAVEIVDLFTKQAIKQNQGEDAWKDFFKQTSILLDYLEKCLNKDFDILSKNKPKLDEKTIKRLDKYFNNDIKSSMYKLKEHEKNLNILNKFKIFTSSLIETSNIIVDNNYTNEYLLLHISKNETNTYSLHCKTYFKSEYQEAEKDYIDLEKKTINSKTSTVALISTSNIEDIKEAYPNYFADSRIFVNLITLLIIIAEDRIAKDRENLLVLSNYGQSTSVPKNNLMERYF